jgi:hypothetical protein
MNIQEIRSKYPQYSDVSDGDLVGALHKKYYSDIPYADFEKKVFDTKSVKVGAEGLPEAIGETAKDFSGLSKFSIGAAGAVNKAAMRLKQVTGNLTKEDIQGLEEYKALEKASGAAVAGDIGMSILATINPATKVYGAGKAAAERILPAAVAKVVAPTVGAGVSGAAITAATQPTMEGETEVGNAGLGAAGSAVADTLTRGASRLVRPIVQSEPVQKLMKEGIVPSIGQALGGVVNKVEQQLESVPVIGWVVSNARGRAVKELDEAAIRKALPENAGPQQIKAGRDGIEKAGELIDNAYDSAYATIRNKVKADDKFAESIKGISKREGIDLPPELNKRFEKLIEDRVLARLEDGASAETLRNVHNSLGALSRKYKGSLDPDQRALGQAFAEAKSELRSLISRQSDGEFKSALDSLDKKYAALLTVEKASGYAGSKDGIFSAEALKSAAKKSSGEMRDLAQTGSDVLGKTVPDSGTAGRGMLPFLPAAIGGAAGAGNEYMGGPEYLTALAAAPLLYSRAGSRYALGDLPLQQSIANALRGSSPYASQVGREFGDRLRSSNK